MVERERGAQHQDDGVDEPRDRWLERHARRHITSPTGSSPLAPRRCSPWRTGRPQCGAHRHKVEELSLSGPQGKETVNVIQNDDDCVRHRRHNPHGKKKVSYKRPAWGSPTQSEGAVAPCTALESGARRVVGRRWQRVTYAGGRWVLHLSLVMAPFTTYRATSST